MDAQEGFVPELISNSSATPNTSSQMIKMSLTDFPEEIILQMLSFMSAKGLCQMATLCKVFNTLSESNELWEPLFRRDKQGIIFRFTQDPKL
jgi:hypothetical protein